MIVFYSMLVRVFVLVNAPCMTARKSPLFGREARKLQSSFSKNSLLHGRKVRGGIISRQNGKTDARRRGHFKTGSSTVSLASVL